MHKKIPRLTVMVGLSGSGKSSQAKKMGEILGDIVISTDVIREEICGEVEDQSKNKEVFQIFHKRIREALEMGKDVVADATNITMKSRRAIFSCIAGLDVFKECWIKAKPFNDCLKDNKNRAHPVPEDVLFKQLRKFQVPFYEEGWDFIVVDSEVQRNGVSFSSLLDLTKNFDQLNPHHSDSLYVHSLKTCRAFSVMRMKELGHLPLDASTSDVFIAGAKMHDIGKLYTQSFDENGIAHYYGHAEVGSYVVLSEVKYPVEWSFDEILDCCFLINYHMFPFSWNNEKTIKKWKKRFGKEKFDILRKFHLCDIAR